MGQSDLVCAESEEIQTRYEHRVRHLLALAGERRLRSYLGHGEAALAAGHHLVPLVVQHVHEAVGLVLADELRDVGGERRVLRESDPVACGQRHAAATRYSSVSQRFSASAAASYRRGSLRQEAPQIDLYCILKA